MCISSIIWGISLLKVNLACNSKLRPIMHFIRWLFQKVTLTLTKLFYIYRCIASLMCQMMDMDSLTEVLTLWIRCQYAYNLELSVRKNERLKLFRPLRINMFYNVDWTRRVLRSLLNRKLNHVFNKGSLVLALENSQRIN